MFQAHILWNLKENLWVKLEKMVKNLISALILARLAQIRATNNLFKNLALSVTRYYGQLSLCTISEKTKDPILRNLVTDGRMYGQTGEQIDRREWFHRTLSDWRRASNNFKEPKLNLRITKFAISSRGPRLWNKLTIEETKACTYDKRFKNITKDLFYE